MASMVIRNIPDDVIERFKARARAEGKSAEELGREAIAEKAKLSRDEVWARIGEIRARTLRIDSFDVVEEVRSAREGRTDRVVGNLPGTGT